MLLVRGRTRVWRGQIRVILDSMSRCMDEWSECAFLPFHNSSLWLSHIHFSCTFLSMLISSLLLTSFVAPRVFFTT
jgi:hypothetical protein